jgi:hypothetical protein
MSKLDFEIDRAVREMLDVEPPAGLRARVLGRLESPRRGMSWIWLVAPVAAAAVIILAVLVPWRHAAPPVVTSAPPSIANVEPLPIVPPATSPKTPESPRTVSIPVPHTTPSGGRGIEERLVVATVVAADDATVIDPLAPIAPITVPAVRTASITPTEIAISPLAPIAELQIAPLSPPERRN